MNKIIRQGDVLAVKISSLPAGATKTRLDKGDIILAYGEVTGHAHRIKKPEEKALLWDAGAERFLQVMETVSLTHEEHKMAEFEPGIYRIVIQQEYSPAALRNVAD